MYFDNLNYGANLQAYALRRVVSAMGFQAEMISFYNGSATKYVLSRLKRAAKSRSPFMKRIKARKDAVLRFNREIPHSKIYFPETLGQAGRAYDVLIVGSDQVWNPDWINPFYALDFAGDKPTIAYAASVGKTRLDDEQKQKLRHALDNTAYISVREKESVPMLAELTPKELCCALDPTLLLRREDWDALCSARIVEDDYLFCYFLGSDESFRTAAAAYAAHKGLKLVTLPYLNGKHRAVDDGFGDLRLYDVSPEDFLSLIKYASFVMTDSFHGAVFCHLYERPFVVAGGNHGGMGCRMRSLTELFGTEARYIRDGEPLSLERLLSLENSTAEPKRDSCEAMREQSLHFLKGALER